MAVSFRSNFIYQPIYIELAVYLLHNYCFHVLQVFTAFNQAESERAKLSELLTQSQDKSFRRISELKEQSELERKSKQHLETSLQSTLEEKDTEISTLKTKVDDVM